MADQHEQGTVVVSTAIVSREGTPRRILRTELLNADEALFAPVFLLIGDVIDRQEQMLYVVKNELLRQSVAAAVAFPSGSIAASGLRKEGAPVSAGAGQRPRQ
jgi:hypothetical protein